MTRRMIIGSFALVVMGALGAPALAAQGDAGNDNRHQVCVLASEDPNSQQDGICVWVPIYGTAL